MLIIILLAALSWEFYARWFSKRLLVGQIGTDTLVFSWAKSEVGVCQ